MPVYLVGAGPGDPELLTRKAQRLLTAADAVLYDALANPALLDLAPAAAERCYVGKRRGAHSLPQSLIADWMIARARRGLHVVRLQGGDPLIFGRCGEEIAALTAAGVPFELVPGINSASGAAAALGVPLTDRQLAAGVRFLSGPGLLASPPAPARETLAVFMGLTQLEAMVAALLAAGWSAATPAALVERATLPVQRAVTAPLCALPARARAFGLAPPALLLIGEVIARPSLSGSLGIGQATRGVTECGLAPIHSGLILVAHASSSLDWQHRVQQLAHELAQPGQFSRAAFLAPTRPGLPEVVRAAVAQGVRRLAVVPYFLAPGLHVRRDLPALVAAARRRFPTLEIVLADCLEGHPALRTALLTRAADALASAEPNAVALPAGLSVLKQSQLPHRVMSPVPRPQRQAMLHSHRGNQGVGQFHSMAGPEEPHVFTRALTRSSVQIQAKQDP